MVGRFCPESPPGFVRVAATSAFSLDPLSGESRLGCGYRGPRSAASWVDGCTVPARETGGWAWETLAGAGAKKMCSTATTFTPLSSTSSPNTTTPNAANTTTKAVGGALQSTASLFVVSLSLLHLYC
ncbi:PREDICTED: signal transducer CD24 isoform X2 [Cercocebus atys]|uniref:CD24 molecule n=1 Tax=Cercocebus atys TaxID=9531 RepID=A0A2K5LPW6_CERAT|nr:PREDICTED: signal transducer CD24 isoform X2 [Cercocebus atys]